MRITLPVCGILLSILSAAAQPALTSVEIASARTCEGTAEVQSAPVQPSRDLTIAILSDTLREEDSARIRKEIEPLYPPIEKNQVRLAALSGGNMRSAGPFTKRTQFRAALADLLEPTAPNASVPPLQFYSELAKTLSQVGGGWSGVLLIGNFPDLDAADPAIAGFTEAWLSAQFRTSKVRLDYWAPGSSQTLDRIMPATGGARKIEIPSFLSSTGGDQFFEVSWREPTAVSSFHVCPISLLDTSGQTVLTIPSVAVAAGLTLPSVERFTSMREKLKSLAEALKNPQIADAPAAEADLNSILQIDSQNEEALRLGVDLFRRASDRAGNNAKLAGTLRRLTELKPQEAALFEEMGHLLFRMQDWDAADRALLRVRELKSGDVGVAEELAEIRLRRGDDRGALPFLEETLSGPGKDRQDLWLARADLATRIGDWQRTADSTEHAIALGGVPRDRRTSLVRLYLEHQNNDRALFHARAVAENLPPDRAIRSEYAGFFDRLQQPEEALAAWKRTLEVDPAFEPAHYRVTRLLIDKSALDKSALDDALHAADLGLQAAPKSARLYLAKSEALEKQDRYYDARRTLRQAAQSLSDEPLLARLAEMEDAGGERAAQYYRAVAEALEQSGADPSDSVRRGLEAALRDGDLEDATWFQAKTGASAERKTRSVGTVSIPGGLAALSFVAGSTPSSSERFLVEYARAVVREMQGPDKKAAAVYAERIHEHFRRVAELMGGSKNRITVTISVENKSAQKNAEKVLGLLGWKMRSTKDGVKLEAAEKGERASHQETASALAIDEIGMQQALESGQPFSFDVPVDSADVALGEEKWRTQFYPNKNYVGGIAEAIAGDAQLAETYVALGQMDANTASILAGGLGLKTLAEKFSGLLLHYSSALAIERGRVAVPGGEAADPIWTALAGASPRDPAAFLRALLSKDDGKLLAYYAALSELEIRRQRFFTRTPSRTAKFYELFKDAPEMQRGTARRLEGGSFTEFFSEIPLDEDGSVSFPGSPELWMVAKGESRSAANAAKLLKKARRKAAPDVEDQILLRLARTRYKEIQTERSELDNFLAVVRIDEHRSDPLDEASALLLAQHFADDGAAYPFFAILTGLGAGDFQEFFALADKLRSLSQQERGFQLAPLNSLLEILCLARQRGAIGEDQSTELFGKIVKGLEQASSGEARVIASLDLTREILNRASQSRDNAGDDPDRTMRNLLLGSTPPAEVSIEVSIDGASLSLDPSAKRHAQFQQVLEIQKAPTLATVLALSDAARNLSAGKGDPAAQIAVLDKRAPELFFVEVPKELKVRNGEKDFFEGFHPRRLQELVKDLKEKASKKKVNPKDLDKLAQDYLEEMDAPVRWALEGLVYAYFLTPDDLLVSEDPLLLRKHQFLPVWNFNKTPLVFKGATLEQSSEKAGSYFTGGFADFASAAGMAGAMSAKLGGPNGLFMAGKQLAALRATHWEMLREEDLRLAGLKIAVAREWIARAASQPELETSLGEAAFGLFSLTRRQALLESLAERDWRFVWSLPTLSDLYFLGDRYLERYHSDAWSSPATRALREIAAHNDGSRLQWLGQNFTDTMGCSDPHLRALPPYEEYEQDLRPLRLAERSAELKLYLARLADREGWPAAALATLAEPAAQTILKRMQLADMHDWRSALAAYAALDGKVAQEALTKK